MSKLASITAKDKGKDNKMTRSEKKVESNMLIRKSGSNKLKAYQIQIKKAARRHDGQGTSQPGKGQSQSGFPIKIDGKKNDWGPVSENWPNFGLGR